MLRPETHLAIASQADYLAGVASGEGHFGLANSLWAFESKHKALAEEARVLQAQALRDGTLNDVQLDMALLHALRKRQLINREEFERFRARVEGGGVSGGSPVSG